MPTLTPSSDRDATSDVRPGAPTRPPARSTCEPVRVAVHDESEVIRAGVTRMLAPYRERIALVDGGPAGADVTLWDPFPPGSAPELGVSPPSSHAAVYSWDVTPATIERALSEGACGYLSKELSAGALVNALERLGSGEVVVDCSDASAAPPGPSASADEVGLTGQEREIVALICHGLRNAEIASHMYLSINTIKTYIRSAYRKMGVSSRSQAVLWGIQHHLLDPDDLVST